MTACLTGIESRPIIGPMVDIHQDIALGITLLPSITDRQSQVLVVIHKYVLEKQNYPTQREIADLLGFTQATTGQHIEALVRKGYLSKQLGEARRNIRLTPLAVERIKYEENATQLHLI